MYSTSVGQTCCFPEEVDVPARKYVVELTSAERDRLEALLKRGKVGVRTSARARVLVHAADGATDSAIAAAVRVGSATVERIRHKFVEGSLDWALRERPRPGGQRKLDGKQAAFLVALSR
jgi:hypothetical protein